MPPRKRTPASESSSALEAVTKLMTERQKYEQWLRELDEKKDTTPEKVFVRVKEDYSTRLQEVVDALREHTSAMQEHDRNLMVRKLEAVESFFNSIQPPQQKPGYGFTP